MRSHPRARVTRREAIRLFAGAGVALVSTERTDAERLARLGQGTRASAPTFPRGAIIRTLLKDLPPDELKGPTLFHEHLSMTNPMPHAPPPSAPVPPSLYQNVGLLVEEIRAAAQAGVVCIVDGGHADMGRSMDALRRIAKESGVHIVASGGYYTDRLYPPDIAAKDEDQIAEDLVREAAAERFGTFGEIGTSSEMTPAERKVFRAVGKAHVRTGLPIFTHNAVYRPDAREAAMRAAMAQLDVLESVGVKPAGIAVGHLCCHDDPGAEVPKAVARRGAYVGFDRITFNNILPDEKRVRMARAVMEAGYADQLLLSGDMATCCENAFKTNRGPGFARALTVFSPMMITAGIPENTVRALYVNNPRRFLAFVPPTA